MYQFVTFLEKIDEVCHELRVEYGAKLYSAEKFCVDSHKHEISSKCVE